MTQLAQALVVGSNGKFGQVFASKLARSGLSVTGLDLDPQPATASSVSDYYQGSVAKLPPAVREVLGSVDCIVLCVPEDALLQSLADLLTSVRDEVVVVDILSVKKRVAGLFQTLGREIGYLSIHPLFPPMEDFSRFPMCAVSLGENCRSKAFLELLSGWGSKITTLNASEHDAVMASVQTTPHAALLAFGLAISKSKVPFELLWRLSTPIQKSMLALLFRVVSSEHVDSHWLIQRNNESASNARSSLEECLHEVATIVEAGDAKAFDGLCSSLRTMFGPATSELGQAAASLLVSQQHRHIGGTSETFLEIE